MCLSESLAAYEFGAFHEKKNFFPSSLSIVSIDGIRLCHTLSVDYNVDNEIIELLLQMHRRALNHSRISVGRRWCYVNIRTSINIVEKTRFLK